MISAGGQARCHATSFRKDERQHRRWDDARVGATPRSESEGVQAPRRPQEPGHRKIRKNPSFARETRRIRGASCACHLSWHVHVLCSCHVMSCTVTKNSSTTTLTFLLLQNYTPWTTTKTWTWCSCAIGADSGRRGAQVFQPWALAPRDTCAP